jgi:GNAT superfamily N-acetyltransferase
MVTLEYIDPQAEVHAASSILSEAWDPPALAYTTEYLAWQFAFPADLAAVGVIARDAGHAIGFAAAIPRRVRFRETTISAYVVSFVAVRPMWRGRGIARELYAVLLGKLRKASTIVVTFVNSGTPAQSILESAYGTAGFVMRRLSACIGYGYIGERVPDVSTISRPVPSQGQVPPQDWLEIADACCEDQTLWGAPTIEQLAYYLRDPRPRYLVLHQGHEEDVVAGMLVRANVVTPKGVQAIPVLDTVFPAKLTSRALREVFAEAYRLWPTSRSTGVSAPNLSVIDPLITRGAGARMTRARFDSYIFSTRRDDYILAATRTNLEVI